MLDSAGAANAPLIFVASDDAVMSVSALWKADPRVLRYTAGTGGHTFTHPLSRALYSANVSSPRFRTELRAEANELLVEMVLLSAAEGAFWPTLGSTMSETVCYWRLAWGR